MFQQRIATLGQLLREANAAATGPPPPAPAPGGPPAPPPLASAALLVPALQRADDGSGAGSSGSRLGGGKGKERAEDTLDDEVPDGGMPIRDVGPNGGQGDPVHELKKVSEVRWPDLACPA